MRTDELADWPPFKALGPEPFDLDAPELKRRLAGRSARSSCCCSTSGSLPGSAISTCAKRSTAPASIRGAQGDRFRSTGLKRLVPAIHDVLTEAIAAGGSTLKDFASPDGELGYFSKSFAVYDREGQPCGCGGTVRRIVQGGRSTFYCPQCQH